MVKATAASGSYFHDHIRIFHSLHDMYAKKKSPDNYGAKNSDIFEIVPKYKQ